MWGNEDHCGEDSQPIRAARGPLPLPPGSPHPQTAVLQQVLLCSHMSETLTPPPQQLGATPQRPRGVFEGRYGCCGNGLKNKNRAVVNHSPKSWKRSLGRGERERRKKQSSPAPSLSATLLPESLLRAHIISPSDTGHKRTDAPHGLFTGPRTWLTEGAQ